MQQIDTDEKTEGQTPPHHWSRDGRQRQQDREGEHRRNGKNTDQRAISPVEGMARAELIGIGLGEAVQRPVHHIDKPDREEQDQMATRNQCDPIGPREGGLPENGDNGRVEAQDIEPKPPRCCARDGRGNGCSGHEATTI